jgi:hypothetical protein
MGEPAQKVKLENRPLIRWKQQWLFAPPDMAEQITQIDVNSLPKRQRRFTPRDLAKLTVISHLLRTGTNREVAIETGERVADHVLWFAIMRGYGSVLVTGRDGWIRDIMFVLKARPDVIEEAIGGKPTKDSWNSVPAVHRFAIRRDSIIIGQGLGYELVDSIENQLGKLKPFNSSVHVLDLWEIGEYLSSECGPLIEFRDAKCPAGQHMYATIDPKKLTAEMLRADDMTIYSPVRPRYSLHTRTFGGAWDAED